MTNNTDSQQTVLSYKDIKDSGKSDNIVNPRNQHNGVALNKGNPNKENIGSFSTSKELEQKIVFMREQIQKLIREKTQLQNRTELLEKNLISLKEENNKLVDENRELELENERFIIQLDDLIPLNRELREENENLNKIIAQIQDDELTKLEKIIKTNFYDVGKALKTIQEKKLYLKTHKSFKTYYQKTFNFSKNKCESLISAATIMDNFSSHNKSTKDPGQKINILPNAESQIRSLKSLEAPIQIILWQQAVQFSQGKVPTAKIVNAVVNLFKRRDSILDTEDKLPQIKFVPVTKPFIGQKIRVKEIDTSFAGIEGIITQIHTLELVIVQLEGRETREIINIENLEEQTIIFPPKENKSYPRFDGINYQQGNGSEWYLRLGKETYERLKDYSEKIGKTVGGIINGWLDREIYDAIAM